MVLLSEIVTALEADWPPRWSEAWDAIGLVVGDPDAEVERVHFAVDPTEQVAAEALAAGAQLLVTHHPLFLRGTSTVAATGPKGRLVHALIGGGCALLTAHTNADSALHGVNDALAQVFSLTETTPLAPQSAAPLLKLVVFVPVADADRLQTALAEAGAGRLGNYDRCGWRTTGQGSFRPLPGAQPAIGAVGTAEVVPEVRVEVVLDRGRQGEVLAAMRCAHPYEQPAYDLLERAAEPTGTGLGRVGQLPVPLRLVELVELAAAVLPSTAWGVRAAGDPDQVVRRLAVCGGAGDSLIGLAAAAGAEAFLTSDLRHHVSAERPTGLALLDAAHWATEWPWLPVAADRLTARTGLTTSVSALVTDPFCLHRGGPA